MFAAVLGHDLRNPLNTIRMAAHVVSRTKGDPDSAEALSQIGEQFVLGDVRYP